jgi:hypothetical protein
MWMVAWSAATSSPTRPGAQLQPLRRLTGRPGGQWADHVHVDLKVVSSYLVDEDGDSLEVRISAKTVACSSR